MFYIGFTTAVRVDDEGWHHAMGGIELGASSDDFAADLHFWNTADYEAQWREGVARLAAGHASSALVTSYRGPDAAFHSMWPMWRVGNTVFVQERRVLDDTIIASRVSEQFYARVGDRRTRNEDGAPIREWAVPFADMLSFLADA
jgi:hypothetical protein